MGAQIDSFRCKILIYKESENRAFRFSLSKETTDGLFTTSSYIDLTGCFSESPGSFQTKPERSSRESNWPTFLFQVRPILPDGLSRLDELAGDMWFSWVAKARALFFMMDPILWSLCGHNPRTFLRRISQKRLNEIAGDRAFLALYNGVMSDYDTYKEDNHQWFHGTFEDADEHLIAYFSAEFGLHESLPIYSGGLGILAGDHCKSASDLGLNFIG
jgi:Glucan phosphorylase